MAVAAPARRSSAPATAPAPSRTSPPRKRKAAPKRKTSSRVAAGGHLIPLAVGRTAVAVRQLPDSGLVVRMTRGRAWIAVLGVLLVGIVALNVVTLSFAASSSKVDERNTALEEENSALRSRLAQRQATKKLRHEAALRGLAMPTTEEPTVIEAGKKVVSEAARRLAAAG